MDGGRERRDMVNGPSHRNGFRIRHNPRRIRGKNKRICVILLSNNTKVKWLYVCVYMWLGRIIYWVKDFHT